MENDNSFFEQIESNLDSGMNSQELRKARGDGFLNKELRSLNVAALLRIIFAMIESAPTTELKL